MLRILRYWKDLMMKIALFLVAGFLTPIVPIKAGGGTMATSALKGEGHSMPGRKVVVNEDECIGCGACFTEGLIDEGDGKARVLRELKENEDFDPDVCPTGALRVNKEG